MVSSLVISRDSAGTPKLCRCDTGLCQPGSATGNWAFVSSFVVSGRRGSAQLGERGRGVTWQREVLGPQPLLPGTLRGPHRAADAGARLPAAFSKAAFSAGAGRHRVWRWVAGCTSCTMPWASGALRMCSHNALPPGTTSLLRRCTPYS